MRKFLIAALLLAGCEKEPWITENILVTGNMPYKASFDKPNGAHWFDVDFEPRFAKAIQVSLPEGDYIITAVRKGSRDTIVQEFKKTAHWAEIGFYW